MKKERKSGLEKTTQMFLDEIEKGKDFVVSKLEAGSILLPIPYQVFDCEPHVCDFEKAGVSKEDAAFYFAYVLTGEHLYQVFDENGKEYEREHNEYPKMADRFRYRKFEKEVMPKVWNERKLRIENKKQTEEETL